MSKKTNKHLPVAAVEFRFTIDPPVAQKKAWAALTGQVHAWWPKDFRATGPDSRITLEPRLSGRLFETSDDGNGLVWYQVIALDAPRSLLLSGVIAAPFGGPAMSLLRLTLQENGAKATVLEVHDALFGHIEGCDAESGWRTVFGSLASYLK
ncbi:MAG: SRPBCC domain-containing protein [Myxococcaceae bacterium]